MAILAGVLSMLGRFAGRRFEDELECLGAGAWQRSPADLVRHLRSLDHGLARLAVPFEEWETLYRMRLQLERDALVAMAEGSELDLAVMLGSLRSNGERQRC